MLTNAHGHALFFIGTPWLRVLVRGLQFFQNVVFVDSIGTQAAALFALFVHVSRVPFAFVGFPRRILAALVVLVPARLVAAASLDPRGPRCRDAIGRGNGVGTERIERRLRSVRVEDVPLLARAAPANRVLRRAPLVGTHRLLHGRPVHVERNLEFRVRLCAPVRRDGKHLAVPVVIFPEPVLGIVMNEDARVP